MITKHFFKILTIFAVMIVIGLIGVFLSSNLDQGKIINTDTETQVAK